MRHYWVKGMCIFTFDRRCQFAVHTGCALNMPTIMRDCLFSSLWPTPQQIFSVPHEFLCLPSPLCVLRLCMDSLLQTFSSITPSPLCHILCRCRNGHRPLPLLGKILFVLQVLTQMPRLLWSFLVFSRLSQSVASFFDLPQHCVHAIFIALTACHTWLVLILQVLLICVSSVRIVSTELIFTGWMCKVLY